MVRPSPSVAQNWPPRRSTADRQARSAYYEALANFDFWLRSDGHRRNPGTTADLVAAGLFVLLREGIMNGPLFG